MSDSTSTATVALARALGFSPDDLEANRAGQLSPMQDYRLRLRRRRIAFIGALLVLGLAFVATVFLYLGGQDGSTILTVIGIGLTLCNAALLGVFARGWLRVNADIQRGEVVALSGEMQRVIKPVSRQVFNYVVRVGQAELFVSKEAFEAFGHTQQPVLYRVPYSGTLLSAEDGHDAPAKR